MFRINVCLEYVRAEIVYESLFHKSRSRVHVSSDETTQHVYPNCVICQHLSNCQSKNKRIAWVIVYHF